MNYKTNLRGDMETKEENKKKRKGNRIIIFIFCIVSMLLGLIGGLQSNVKIKSNTGDVIDACLNEGKMYIRLGVIWFVFWFILSIPSDLILFDTVDRGTALVLLSLFFNLPGTCILIRIGAIKLEACKYEVREIEARKILHFGVFWLFFWIVLSALGFILNVELAFSFIVAIFGTVAIIAIGNRLSGEESIRRKILHFILNKKNYEKAKELANEAKAAASERKSGYDLALKSISEVERVLNETKDKGVIISSAEELLIKSKQAFGSGDYEGAIKLS